MGLARGTGRGDASRERHLRAGDLREESQATHTHVRAHTHKYAHAKAIWERKEFIWPTMSCHTLSLSKSGQEPEAFYWLTFYTDKDHLPMGSIAHCGWALPYQLTIKNAQRACLQANLLKAILQWEFSLPRPL